MSTSVDNVKIEARRRTTHVRKIVSTSAGIIAGVIVLAAAISITYEILLRNVAGRGTSWVYDFSGYSLVWFTMLAGVAAADTQKHIRVEVFLEHTSKRTQQLVHALSTH